MADTTTFVKIDRNIRGWRWFKNPKTMLVWIWLITSANFEDHDFEHETIRRGEVATSRKSISADTGLSEREVRTALTHLKETGEVTVRVRSKYQVITILEYDKYQDVRSGNASGKSPAKVRQKSGKRPQLKNKRMEEGKEGKNIYPPTVAEVEEFAREEGLNLDAAAFIDYNTARGWAAITDWRPLARLRSRQLSGSGTMTNDDELDDFGRPIEKEFK